MLSIKECRKHLVKDCELTDEQVLELRDSTQQLAEIIFDKYINDEIKNVT